MTHATSLLELTRLKPSLMSLKKLGECLRAGREKEEWRVMGREEKG